MSQNEMHPVAAIFMLIFLAFVVYSLYQFFVWLGGPHTFEIAVQSVEFHPTYLPSPHGPARPP